MQGAPIRKCPICRDFPRYPAWLSQYLAPDRRLSLFAGILQKIPANRGVAIAAHGAARAHAGHLSRCPDPRAGYAFATLAYHDRTRQNTTDHDHRPRGDSADNHKRMVRGTCSAPSHARLRLDSGCRAALDSRPYVQRTQHPAHPAPRGDRHPRPPSSESQTSRRSRRQDGPCPKRTFRAPHRRAPTGSSAATAAT